MKPTNHDGLILGQEGHWRCWWAGNHADYIAYHDREWGRPITDDRRLFEKICLEGFQSGLSWLTILRKRENFRQAFADFDFHQIAEYDEQRIEHLLQDAGIVRHRRKIISTINNARRAQVLVAEFGSLAAYFWQFEPKAIDRPNPDYATLSTLSQTPASIALSKDLKRRGWSFVGPTTAYAFMQAMGLVNDHLEGCWLRQTIEDDRSNFVRPTVQSN